MPDPIGLAALGAAAAQPAAQPGAEAPIAPPQAANGNILSQLGLSAPNFADLDRAVSRSMARNADAQGQLAAVAEQRADVVNDLENIPRPEAPTLQDVPSAPPVPEPTDTLRVFGQFLPVLAMLGGAMIRNNATGALQAGAAAMQAAKDNDAEALERANHQWELNLQSVLSQNEQALQEYNAALSLRESDMNGMLARLNALAAQEQNPLLQAQIQQGDVTAIGTAMNMRMQANQQIISAMEVIARVNAARDAGNVQRLGGAEMRGRLALALPNIIEANGALDRIEMAEGRNGARGNVFSREWGARALETVPFDGGAAARWAGGDDYQAYESASRSFESAMLPIFSGAAVTPSEAQRFIRANLPQINDTPETLARKSANRAAMVNQASIIVGAAPPFPDAGYFSPLTGVVERQPIAVLERDAGGGSPAPLAQSNQIVPGNYDWNPDSGLSPRR